MRFQNATKWKGWRGHLVKSISNSFGAHFYDVYILENEENKTFCTEGQAFRINLVGTVQRFNFIIRRDYLLLCPPWR